MTDPDLIAEVGNLPVPLDPRRVEALKASYRERVGIAADAEVVFVADESDPQRGFLYQPGTFIRLDGGKLILSGWRWRDGLRRRARYAWGWLRYGWRWWE